MKSSDLLSAPLTVNWSLSYRCNFTCSHCYSRALDTGTLSLDELFRIVDLLAEKGVVFINFGGGEPLLLDDLYRITGHAVSRGLKVTMNSNGWLLDQGAAGRIREAGFHSVGISIDSPEPAGHDRFRDRPGSFVRAVEALGHLREAGVRSTVSCVINRGNLHNWREMVGLCREQGVGTLYLHNYKCSGKGLVNMEELDLTPGQWGQFYTGALAVREKLDDLTISFDDPIMAALPGYSPDAAVKGSTCGKLSLHIGPDGRITPCGFIPISLGHILNDDFDEIWFNSPILEKMRSKTPRGKCAGCSSYEDCLGGCSARAFAMTGSFEDPDPHCWVEEGQSKVQSPKSKG
ncbi:MAG: GeoRSP system radical SAM/SPASM protein [bacterium]|nr:GeoRSP system radical SAM/SPASM protein [bacterium]MDT8395014.1 GeoRSP system radical SAM/SPASM protein [bacterium]